MIQSHRPLLNLARCLSEMFPDNVEIWSDQQIMDRIAKYFDEDLENITREEIRLRDTPEDKSLYDARMRRKFYETQDRLATTAKAKALHPKP